MSGSTELEAFIAGVETLRTMNERVAKEAEEGVLKAAQSSAQKAQTPAGAAWPDLRAGGPALRGADAAIESSAKGNRITLSIGKPWVFHQHGAGGHSTTKDAVRARKRAAAKQAETGTKSKFHAPRRQILPDPGEPIPASMKDEISKAAERVFGKAMGG